MTHSALVQKYNIQGPRYTSYPTVPYWDQDSFSGDAWKSSLIQSFKESNFIKLKNANLSKFVEFKYSIEQSNLGRKIQGEYIRKFDVKNESIRCDSIDYINLVGYCNGKHTINYVRIKAYEAFVFGNDYGSPSNASRRKTPLTASKS